jgi:hypothetical protein
MSEHTSIPPPETASIQFLSQQGQELRQKLIDILQHKNPKKDAVVSLIQQYEQGDVQRVLPTIIGRFIDKKSQEQARAETIREAVITLEERHQYKFTWNRVYRKFVQGLGMEEFQRARTTTNDIAYVKSVFGEAYETTLGLSPEAKNSKCRELVPLGRLTEQLNLELDTLKQLLFSIRDQRLLRLLGSQGVRQSVTGEDLKILKNELHRLVWTTVKAPQLSPTQLSVIGSQGSNHRKFITI